MFNLEDGHEHVIIDVDLTDTELLVIQVVRKLDGFVLVVLTGIHFADLHGKQGNDHHGEEDGGCTSKVGAHQSGVLLISARLSLALQNQTITDWYLEEVDLLHKLEVGLNSPTLCILAHLEVFNFYYK